LLRSSLKKVTEDRKKRGKFFKIICSFFEDFFVSKDISNKVFSINPTNGTIIKNQAK
jgi:hypothetical protein